MAMIHGMRAFPVRMSARPHAIRQMPLVIFPHPSRMLAPSPRISLRATVAAMPRIVRACFVIDLFWMILYPIRNRMLPLYSTYVDNFFDLDGKSNGPTWWSASQLLLIAVLIGITAWQVTKPPRASRALWLACFLFVYLSLDNGAQIHQKFGRALDMLVHLGDRRHSSLPHSGVWFFFCLPAFLVALYLFGRSAAPALAGRREIGMRFLAGALMFSLLKSLLEWSANYLGRGAAYGVEVFFEEGFQRIGETVMIWACLDLLRSHGVRMVREIKSADDEPVQAGGVFEVPSGRAASSSIAASHTIAGDTRVMQR